MKNRGMLYMALAALCWSFGGLCIKFIPWDAPVIVGVRGTLAAVVFLIYRRRFRIKFSIGNVLGAICLCATTFLFVIANKMTTAAAAILLQFTSPIFIVLFQFVFERKKPKHKELVAVLGTFAGMALFFVQEVVKTGGSGFGAQAVWGNLIAILSGVSFAGIFFCNRRPDTDPNDSLFLGFLLNAVIGLPFIITGVTADLSAWGFVIFLGIVQVGLAYVFFAKGIVHTPALHACLLTAIEPVLNPVLVWLATGEFPGFIAVAGGVAIIGAVVGYNMSLAKEEQRAAD